MKLIKKFLHRWFHFWTYPGCFGASRAMDFAPGDRPGHFMPRKCSVCGHVEINAFETFGDKQWYGFDTLDLHCWPSEFKSIVLGLLHHGWIAPGCPNARFHPPLTPHVVTRLHHNKEAGCIACECACGCAFLWWHPAHWETLKAAPVQTPQK